MKTEWLIIGALSVICFAAFMARIPYMNFVVYTCAALAAIRGRWTHGLLLTWIVNVLMCCWHVLNDKGEVGPLIFFEAVVLLPIIFALPGAFFGWLGAQLGSLLGWRPLE